MEDGSVVDVSSSVDVGLGVEVGGFVEGVMVGVTGTGADVQALSHAVTNTYIRKVRRIDVFITSSPAYAI
jgi:hypothetical protein